MRASAGRVTLLSMATLAVQISTDKLPPGVKADRVVVIKSKRLLMLEKEGKVLKAYRVALGGHPVGPKTQEGDSKTPEGHYRLDSRNANSKFYRSIHVSYPNASDAAAARKRGVRPGGAIMIHGLPREWAWVGKLHVATDWTDGCIAVSNEEMDEIWRAVSDGTPIDIQP